MRGKPRGSVAGLVACLGGFGSVTHGTRLSAFGVFMQQSRYGALAGLPLEAHLHMLRHACGYALADQGADTRLNEDYLGHRNIQHTVRYTATNSARFEKLWR